MSIFLLITKVQIMNEESTNTFSFSKQKNNQKNSKIDQKTLSFYRK